MLPTEDLFTYVYVLVDDLITAGAIAIPPRPGPAPACSDAELLAIAIVRHLLSGRSEAGFLAEEARDWSHLFPIVPHQSEANRRIRWLWGAFEQFRRWLAGLLPADNRQQVDTSALPADSVLEPSCNRARREVTRREVTSLATYQAIPGRSADDAGGRSSAQRGRPPATA